MNYIQFHCFDNLCRMIADMVKTLRQAGRISVRESSELMDAWYAFRKEEKKNLMLLSGDQQNLYKKYLVKEISTLYLSLRNFISEISDQKNIDLKMGMKLIMRNQRNNNETNAENEHLITNTEFLLESMRRYVSNG